MNGLVKFLGEASQDTALGPVIITFLLATLFFSVTYGLSGTDSGFVIAIAVAMFAAGIVSLIMFFLALGSLFFD